MQADSARFPENVAAARRDETLLGALHRLQRDARAGRAETVSKLPEFEALRDAARDIRNGALANLAGNLERFEENVVANGGEVHWCRDAAEACAAVARICREAGAKTVAKGKSMVSEEIRLNAALIDAGFDTVETDLGEYVLQLRDETPSHIVIPAIHLTKDQFAETFRGAHDTLPEDRPLEEARAITDEARGALRDVFLRADVGITGANFLIAETGSVAIVTNEGNGDLAQSLPRTHVVVTGIEKALGTVEEALTLIRVLARSATGQEISAYTTFATGAKRADDAAGPENFHVVLVDNGRGDLLAGPKREILRCIRCGACQTVCPVYGAVGGHAYGAVYAGPVGSVLTPALSGLEKSKHLPEASSFCGACEGVCPVRIPLPRLLRMWREDAFQAHLGPKVLRWGLFAWSTLTAWPWAYRTAGAIGGRMLRLMAMGRGRLTRLPFAGKWTGGRDLPVPEGGTFVGKWHRRRGK